MSFGPKLNAPSTFNELLLRIYRLSQELPIDSFQDAVLNQLKEVLPFDSAMWGTATAKTSGIEIHTIHLHETSSEMIAEYESVKHLDTAAATVLGQPLVTSTFNTATWFTEKEDRPLRDYLARFEHENIFITAENNKRTQFVHWLSLFRADADAHGTEDQRILLSQLSPHIMQALGLNRVMHLDRLELADRALSPHGSAIADVRGIVYHADPLFSLLTEAEWCDWGRARLPNELMNVFLRGAGTFHGRTMVVRSYVEHGLLFLKARSRCKADNLSGREKAVAKLISEGATHKEIAQKFDRAPATIRNQIQAIYEKLSVNSIARLIEELRKADLA